MAVQTTQNLPAPYIEDALKGFLPQMGGLAATDSTTALGLPSLAPESAFTGQARKAGAEQAGLTYDPSTNVLGAGTGVAAYEPYLTKAATYADPANVSAFYIHLKWITLSKRCRMKTTEHKNVLSRVKHYNQELLEEEDMESQSGIMDSQLAQQYWFS